LRAIGISFDVDAFLEDTTLEGASVFRRGEPKFSGQPDGEKRTASGFNLGVSQAGFDDVPSQVSDATRFLGLYEEELRRLTGFEGVEEVCLDFGVERRDVAAQRDVFPADLLWRAGALDIDLVVTQLAVSEGAGEEPKRSGARKARRGRRPRDTSRAAHAALDRGLPASRRPRTPGDRLPRQPARS
jgi:hypothetical protein